MCNGREQCVVTHQMPVRSGNERRELGDKVQRLEQHVSRAIRERAFEFVDHEPVTIDAQAFERNRGSGDVAAKAFELGSLVGLAGHGGIE